MRYLPHTEHDIEQMLATIGKPNIQALFTSIPEHCRVKKPLALDDGKSELELKAALQKRATTKTPLSFLGAGATAHFVPEAVSQMLLRSEWYTAYTPYQPEMAQGTLQAIFEFQTIVANLFGCEIANASMYDGATAFAEGLLMAARLKPNAKRFVLSRAIHPEYREVAHTYLKPQGFIIDEIDFTQTGRTDVKSLEHSLHAPTENVACIAYQTPNFFGQLEHQQALIDIAHRNHVLVVAVNTDPSVFGMVRAPASVGADIVVGEGLSFCGHLHLGAPGVGLFATAQKHVRQMPGRLCGVTVDNKNNRGFVLTLSTREQHIRRERATSNICTNHNLMALAFAITTSLYGKSGLIDLAKCNMKKTIYFRKKAESLGLKLHFFGPHYNETVIEFTSSQKMHDKLLALEEKDIFAGCALSRWYPKMERHLLVSTTELHRDDDINTLLKGLQ